MHSSPEALAVNVVDMARSIFIVLIGKFCVVLPLPANFSIFARFSILLFLFGHGQKRGSPLLLV